VPSSDLGRENVAEISEELRHLLADLFTLYVKTKDFHWHMTGREFRDYHLLLDEQAKQIFAMRKIGATALHSISDIAKHQRIADNSEDTVSPTDMLRELRSDNRELTRFLRVTHEVCDKYRDVATASLIENWIDEAERRSWFLSEIVGGLEEARA